MRDILPKSKKKYIMVSTEDNEIVPNLLKYDLDKTLQSINYWHKTNCNYIIENSK